jgi:hypothetical protein
MERFLYRLSKSRYAEKFILKGALMMLAWKAPLSRPTMDIDLLGRIKNDVEGIGKVVVELCTLKVPEDGITLDPSSVQTRRINEDAEYQGVRAKVSGRLGNARLALQIDVGFGDIIVPEATSIDYPTLLALPAPRLRGYTRESAVAEKFEAMTKLGILNSRLKDFFDIWSLAREFDFDGTTLSLALRRTFTHRGTGIDPNTIALTKSFAVDPAKRAQWGAFLRRNRLTNVSQDLGEVIEVIAGFLRPVAAALAEDRGHSARWRAPGPWSSE